MVHLNIVIRIRAQDTRTNDEAMMSAVTESVGGTGQMYMRTDRVGSMHAIALRSTTMERRKRRALSVRPGRSMCHAV